MTADPFIAFPLAGDAFVSLLDLGGLESRWNEPSALEAFTIGELVAHVTLAMERAHGFLMLDAPGSDPVSLGGYYGDLKIEDEHDAGSFVHAFIKGMAETEAARPCAEVVVKAKAVISEIAQLLPSTQPSRILDLRPLPQGAMRADDYMATRVVELILHGMDLAVSLDQSMELPPQAVDVVIEILVATARAQHGDPTVLCAMARSERTQSSVFPVL
jgi:uncharacterized protein (TIGR03083 family)